MTSVNVYERTLVDAMLADRQYDKALTYTESLRKNTKPDLTGADLAELYFVQAQCLYRLGVYRKAAIKLKCSIKFADPLNDNLLYARQKGTLGQIYFEMGRLEDALSQFTEASAFFRRVKDIPRMLAAQEMIALIHFHKGNYAQACELNAALLSQVKEQGLTEHVKVVSFNLCRVLLWTGGYERITDLLGSIANDCTDPLSQTWLESLRGTLFVRLLDADKGMKHLEQALSLARENGYRRDEVVCLEYLGLNEYYHGDYKKARSYYEQILAKRELTASAVAQTLRLLTDAHVALGEISKAAETATKAEEAITKIKEWVELGCLHRARALFSDRLGDRGGAREHFAKAFEVLSRHGARYELAVTLLAAGRSESYTNEARLDHLNKSKSLFIDMAVPKRVEQVEQAIGELKNVKTMGETNSTKSRVLICKRLGEKDGNPVIITEDPKTLAILDKARLISNTHLNVLITGETGTGKGLLAKRIHYSSSRAGKPFKVVNMAELNESMVERDLFGCLKGAYTGAICDRKGLIEAANEGTLFLDEIGEVSETVQRKLLRVVDDGFVRRLGDNCDFYVDVRVIAATNQDLQELIKKGQFRPDLFQRLNEASFHLPPLRERGRDPILLASHFLADAGIDVATIRSDQLSRLEGLLNAYDWPGNVRELRAMIYRVEALSPKGDLDMLVDAIAAEMTGANTELQRMRAALRKNGYIQRKAAVYLGIPESTFRYRLKKLTE